jgi:hypothetical protein
MRLIAQTGNRRPLHFLCHDTSRTKFLSVNTYRPVKNRIQAIKRLFTR